MNLGHIDNSDGKQTTWMFVRSLPDFDYYVQWDHVPKGYTGVVRSIGRNPHTYISVYRVKKGCRTHPSNHPGAGYYGFIHTTARLHPNDKYNYLIGERQALRLALGKPMECDLSEKTEPLPEGVTEASLRKPYVFSKKERVEFWKRFQVARLRLHKRGKNRLAKRYAKNPINPDYYQSLMV